MKVYVYSGQNNNGAVLFGEHNDFIRETESGLLAFFGKERGEFSNTCICLGDFDGVHKGHRTLFEEAKKQGRFGVLLFDRNTKNSPLLTTLSEKLEMIYEFGAEYVVITEFSKEFSHKSPKEFVEFLRNDLNVTSVVAGYDYHFGYRASGDAKMLEVLCRDFDISAKIVDEVAFLGEPIKSTRIREYIKYGDIKMANSLLGYSYSVSGIVEKGFGNGRKMGFPTANIEYPEEKLLPPDGVYRGFALGVDAVINIGKNPTLDARKRTIEVHLIGYNEDLYGKKIKAAFIEKIRDDIKFKDLDELSGQIKKDIDYVKEKTSYGKENIN